MYQISELKHCVKKLIKLRGETHKSRTEVGKVNVPFQRHVDRKPRRYMRELDNTGSQE